MNIKDFKKVAQVIKQVLKEVEAEALQVGMDLLSEEYDVLRDRARQTVLDKMGFTLDEYRTVKEKINATSKATMYSFIEDTRKRIKEIDQKHIPTTEEIEEIADAVAQRYIKPPEIINKIVKEVTIEKPQIIKETKIEKVIETVNYNDKPLQDKYKSLEERVDGIKIPKEFDSDKFKESLQNDFSKWFARNIDIMGMPDFRKLGMGLQAQIDELSGNSGSGGGHIIEDEGTPVTQRDTLNFTGTGVSVADSGGKTVVTINGGGSGFTLLDATGSINSSNTAFDFTEKPDYIVSDGAWYRENKGWTWSGSTATMAVPPNDDIYGFT